ncbi:MAG: PAS domain S-box protein, partial [Chitinophagales bacterium]
TGKNLKLEFSGILGPELFVACEEALQFGQYQLLEQYSSEKDQWFEFHIYPSSAGLSILIREITARKKTASNLQAAELRYRSVIEQASDAIMITDIKGNFFDVNSSLCKMFGYEKEELLRMNISSLIDPEQLRVDPIQNDRIAQGLSILRERRMMHRSGGIVEVEANVKMLPDGRVLAIARDITERKKAAELILREKQLSESIINSLPGVFYLQDIHGKYLRWNKQFEIISGYSSAEIKQLHPTDLFEGKDREIIADAIDKVFSEGQIAVEAVATMKSGKKIPFYLTGKAVHFEGRPCLIGTGIDISERKNSEEELKQMNEQLRNLSAHLQHIREEERKAMAREIHDELGQQLTGLKMDVSWLKKKWKKEDEKIFDRLNDMGNLIDQSVKTVRRISSELRPSILDDLGLVDAMEWESVEFEKRFLIHTKFLSEVAELNAPSNISTALFRIYQESLTNVARHAKANHVSATLEQDEEKLTLTIDDDGQGFDFKEIATKKTFGLMGIKERTEMLGGRYSILSEPGKGTSITVSIPMARNAQSQV